MADVDIRVFPDAGGAAETAAVVAGAALAHAAKTGASVFMALSGGTTPRGMYERLAVDDSFEVPWASVHILWGDERCVPPTDSRSNYLMARETGLLDLPLAGVHRMPGELQPLDGARQYEEELLRLFPDTVFPYLDVVVLGLGEDGHTASLVPGAHVLEEHRRWVAAVERYQGTQRLTLTLPVLAHAKHLLFLVTGEAKAHIVGEVLGPEVRALSANGPGVYTLAASRQRSAEPSVFPARALMDAAVARADQEHGASVVPGPRITWVMDAKAASRLLLHE